MLASDQIVVYDTVTLHHFASVARLDILEDLHAHRPAPRWVDEVHAEVLKGLGFPESLESSGRILATAWLGAPVAPSDLQLVFKLQAALATPNREDKNLGEAQSMALVIESGGIFVSDDHAAFDLAANRTDIGAGRVMDACTLLGLSEASGYIQPADVKSLHVDMANQNRTLRCRCEHWVAPLEK